jgi:predicted ATPase
VPAPVGRAVAAELAELAPTARTAVQAAAVTGERLTPASVAAAASMSETEASSGLDAAVLAGLVREAASVGEFAFRHPLVRRAAYESAPPGWRRQAHARAGQALQSTGAHPSAWAHHVERSASRGDESAVEVLAAAAEGVAPQAPATAAR